MSVKKFSGFNSKNLLQVIFIFQYNNINPWACKLRHQIIKKGHMASFSGNELCFKWNNQKFISQEKKKRICIHPDNKMNAPEKPMLIDAVSQFLNIHDIDWLCYFFTFPPGVSRGQSLTQDITNNPVFAKKRTETEPFSFLLWWVYHATCFCHVAEPTRSDKSSANTYHLLLPVWF